MNAAATPVPTAKPSILPVLAMQFLMTGVAVGATILITRAYEERKAKKEKEEEEKERERSTMMPPMPMMWPGTQQNAPAPAAGPGPMGAPAMAAPAPAPAYNPDLGQSRAGLEHDVARLQEWETDLEQREQRLRLVT